jgi:hypothetical protein
MHTRQNKKYKLQEKGGQDGIPSKGGLQSAMRIWLNPPSGLEEVGYADSLYTRRWLLPKVLVQSKNLFRLKGSLGPCLVDENTAQHLPLLGKLLQALRHKI